MNIAETILGQGQDTAVALLYRDKALTYRELRLAVTRVAEELRARGHSAGDRIGIFSENSPFFAVVYFGIIRAGCVAVPFQTELTAETFRRIVADTGIRELFVSRRFANRLRPWAETLDITLLHESESPLSVCDFSAVGTHSRSTSNPLPPLAPASHLDADSHPKSLSPPTSASSLAALMFTSGSTGAPKGVMVTHRNIECNTRDIIAYLGLTPDDRAMSVLPFHYCFGVSLLHTLLMAGGSLVLNNEFRLYPEAMLREMQEKECTGFAGVPSTYQILLRKSRFRQMEFPKLRWFQQAGGKLPNPCIREIRESFPGVQFFLMYGQTEATARLSYLPPARLEDKLGSIGQGLPSTRLEVLKSDGSAVTPGSDEVGEIVATGDNISPGYWNDPNETARYFRNGSLYTGDIARVDAEGFIYIVERARDLIKSGGNRVSAKEVEDVIAELPEVVEVAVVGVPHELLGEAIKAFVVVAPSTQLSAETLLKHCAARLPAYKRPEAVAFLPGLPHNSAGKVLKSQLAAL